MEQRNPGAGPIMSRMENFILDQGEADSYPEPRTELHDGITFEMAESVSKLLPVNGRVLDVGCGQGPALEWFSEKGFDAHGIAVNRADVEACEAKGFDVSLCDQNGLPAFVFEFDLVWARHVLEHSIAPFWTLHEFHRVLKTGGILYVEVPAPETSSDHEGNKNHYSVMGWRMWASLIDRSGFEIMEAKQFPLELLSGADSYFAFQCRKI